MRVPDEHSDPRFRALTNFVARTGDPAILEAVDAVAAEVMTGLRTAGVPFLLLKGPALAALLYRPGEQRGYMDVDLLIAPGKRDAASEVLTRLGFENMAETAGVDDAFGGVPAETWQRERELLGVDVHTRMPACTEPAETVWPKLFGGHQTIVVNGSEAPVLSRAGLALHLAIHAAQHGSSDLKAMGDLERGIERWGLADWQAAAELAYEVGATAALGAGLRLTPAGSELSDQLALPPSTELLWEIENRAARPRGTFHLTALRSGGLLRKVEVLRRALFPRPEWIVRQYPWAAGSRPRLVSGYVRHILRTPRWAVRVWRYERRMRRATGA